MDNKFSFDALPTIIGDLQAQIQTISNQLQEAPAVRGEIVNGKQLCAILGISEPTLIRWRERGKIPFMEIGGAYRYDVNTVIKAISVVTL